jgi:hypothetical protein
VAGFLRAPLYVLLGLAFLAAPGLAQGSLTVNPNVTVEAFDWTEEVLPGVPSTLVVRVTNRAASPDSFRLAATVDATGWEATPERALTRTLAPAGQVPFPDPTNPGVPMPSYVDVNVSVVPPTYALAGLRVPITIIAASTNSTTAHDTLLVNATVLAVHRVSVACSPTRLALPEGGFALMQVTVSNLGNAADEVGLEFEGPGALFVSFSQSPVLLGAGTEAKVAANVTSAPDSEGSHRFDVRTQSQRDRTAGDLCTVDATVTPRTSVASKDSPAAPFFLGAVAVAVALVLRRR